MACITDIRTDLMAGDKDALERILRGLADMLSEGRLKHSIGVAETARGLAVRFDASSKKAYTAGVVHDIARELDGDQILDLVESSGRNPEPWQARKPVLLHGWAGAVLLEKWGLTDPAVLAAVEEHVTGSAGMSRLSQIVFTADYLEPGRRFLKQSVREKMLQLDLDEMTFRVLESLFRYFKGREIAESALALYRLLERRRKESEKVEADR
jgi:predicted HD superfamily hydrolase involved in NAD metabolism